MFCRFKENFPRLCTHSRGLSRAVVCVGRGTLGVEGLEEGTEAVGLVVGWVVVGKEEGLVVRG